MTKKIVSQNESKLTEKENNRTIKEENTMENSENFQEKEDLTEDNQRNEYIYSTPLKRIKLNVPMAPKKKRRNKDVNEYNIKGKNLLNLFQLVA